MRRGRIGLADIGVLALLTALAVGTAFLQNRHQPLALYDQNIRATIEAQMTRFARKMMSLLSALPRPICAPNLLPPIALWPWCGPIIGRSLRRNNSALPAAPVPYRKPRDTAARCLFGR